ncbi:hypothetical protein UFOVP316_9 [uncultured Caudovirales phage]|uniref:Uncharacterized protein n=1 Tax=uncultured Caudovirales phage TaxID=2100421 RepID=A0A6J5LVZ3_9CAUD|nr:hypothetical protein UFOVP316_9 [uncultured Caudovirales phage]
MKIQLIKEVNAKGETWYSIEKDGTYVSSTMTRNFEQAVEHYNNVVKSEPSREILMETEIDY